jgi:hypothetical protein
VPPFFQATSATLQLLVYLDTTRPLSEPKWAKTGDTQEWLKSMFGRMFWVAGDAADGWEKRIHVVDPDPVYISNFKKCRLQFNIYFVYSPQLFIRFLKDGDLIPQSVLSMSAKDS